MKTNEHGYRTVEFGGIRVNPKKEYLTDFDKSVIREILQSKNEDIASRVWVRRVHSRLAAFFSLDDQIISDQTAMARKRLKYAEKQQTERIKACSIGALAEKFQCKEYLIEKQINEFMQ